MQLKLGTASHPTNIVVTPFSHSAKVDWEGDATSIKYLLLPFLFYFFYIAIIFDIHSYFVEVYEDGILKEEISNTISAGRSINITGLSPNTAYPCS